MKICVVNGSPRAKYSVTLHTSLYLEKRFPEHSFTFVDVPRKLNASAQDIQKPAAAMQEADLVIFSYPVYTFIAPSQLHYFIRGLKESGLDFTGKFVTQITTSKHFYDVTAHRYVEDNCHDMGMKVIHGLSADMEDLPTEKGQKEAEAFLRYAVTCVEQDIHEPAPTFRPGMTADYRASMAEREKGQGKEIALVADLSSTDASLQAMIDDFTKAAPYPVKLVNIADYPFQGGCLGCFHCAGDGECIYKDGFDAFLRESIQSAAATVYAFTICDHSMGPRFKMFDDRQFCNGHRTVTEGKPVAYLIHGDYANEANLQTILEARAEVGHNFYAGAAVDASTMETMLRRLKYAMDNGYVQPRNFYGVGGMKIFRDLIWVMRGLMKADHQFYKKHGVYDFPQKQRPKMMVMCLLGAMVRNPKIKAKMGNKFNEGMVAPYQKVLRDAEKKK